MVQLKNGQLLKIKYFRDYFKNVTLYNNETTKICLFIPKKLVK